MNPRTKQRRALAKVIINNVELRDAVEELNAKVRHQTARLTVYIAMGSDSEAAETVLKILDHADHLKACVRDVLEAEK